MKRIFLVMAVCAMALLAGCEKDDIATTKLYVHMENGGKTAIENNKPMWQQDDQIKVNTTPYFVQVVGADAWIEVNETSPYRAIYPASLAPSPITSNTYAITLPAMQQYKAGSVEAPMCAVSDNTDLTFKNICALVAVTIKNSSAHGTMNVRTITLESQTAPLSGDASVDITSGALTMNSTAKKVKLIGISESIAPNEEKTYYVYVPAFSSNTLTATVRTTVDEHTYDYTRTTQPLSIERNQIGKLPIILSSSNETEFIEGGGEGGAKLLFGQQFNAAIKNLANGSSSMTYESYDYQVQHIVFDCNSTVSTGTVVSTLLSPVPIYATWNSTTRTITISTSATSINANADMSYMFHTLQSLNSIECTGLNTSNVTDMSYMFYYCSSLTSLDVSSFNTSSVTDMRCMFYYCSSLTSLDVSSFNTSNVTNMSYMFYICSSLTSLDVSSFNTSSVTLMQSMFYGCSSLTSLDVSNFNTSNVRWMSTMFSGCSSLTSLDVSSFNTENVTDMDYMFYGCSSLTSLNVSSFNTENVTDMGGMFYACTGMQNLNLGSNFTVASSKWDMCKGLATTSQECTIRCTLDAKTALQSGTNLPTEDVIWHWINALNGTTMENK